MVEHGSGELWQEKTTTSFFPVAHCLNGFVKEEVFGGAAFKQGTPHQRADIQVRSTLALLLCKGFATRLYRLPSRSFITTGGAYNRNHSAIPVLDAATHIITVGGDVETSLKLSVAQLKDDFPQHEVICALQCAGNRRHTMRTKLKEVVGIDWLDGAVMNCIWKGPRLRDILLRAGLKEKNPAQSSSHVAFACFQAQCEDDDWYGGSIELWRAMRIDEEVILALEVSFEYFFTSLPFAHGDGAIATLGGNLASYFLRMV